MFDVRCFSISAFHPAAFVYLVYFVVALREITRLRQEKISVIRGYHPGMR
jgi:hypothetical protein